MRHSGGRLPRFTWDYDRAETIADGVVHALGVGFALIGAVAIVLVASRSARAIDLASVLAYAAGLMAMFGLSAAYNLWPVSPAKWVLRRLDHSAIYGLIAGTYTPFIVQINGGPGLVVLLVVIWIAAVVGVVLKVALPGRFDRLAIGLYLLLGWSVVVAYQPVAAALSSLSLWLLVAGGALYTIGVLFHVWGSLRFHNAIWHGFVLAAAACHYVAVLDCVARV